MDAERRKQLKELVSLMNRQSSAPIPMVESLLDAFDLVITPEEADFLLRLGTLSCSFESLKERMGLPEDRFAALFDSIVHKGLLWSRRSASREQIFRVAAIWPGWFEAYLCGGAETPERRQFASVLTRLLDDYSRFNVFPLRGLLNMYFRGKDPHRTVAANLSRRKERGQKVIELSQRIGAGGMAVQPAGSVLWLLEKHGSTGDIALVHCFCRQHQKLEGRSCRYRLPAESCLVLGDYADHIVRYGFGRRLTLEQALELVREVQKRGAVHQVYHDREDVNLPEYAICNCCVDCCDALASYRRGTIPLFLKSFHLAVLARIEDCTGCGTCESFCPTFAISVAGEKATLDGARCIGCGQCSFQCARQVIDMVPDEREVFLPLRKPAAPAPGAAL